MRKVARCAWVMLWLAVCPWLQAQEEPAGASSSDQIEQRNVATLKSLIPVINREKEELARLHQRLAEETVSEERAQLAQQIATKRHRIEQLRANFLTIASGVEEERYFHRHDEGTSINEEIQMVLKPLIHELQDATSAPREMEELRDALELWEERQDFAETAIARLESLNATNPPDDVRMELETALVTWMNRSAEVKSEIEVILAKLDERERKSPSIVEAISNGLSSFWKSRGLNLLLAVAAFFATIFLVRKLYRLVRRLSPVHRKGKLSLAARLVDLGASAGGFVLAAVASLLVLYMKGDWLLLTISAIVIAGLIIASRNSLPPYVEQIRTMLNLGSVREGERIVYNGIAWKVDSLGIYCSFSNPALSGGFLRLPVKELGGMHSRPSNNKEAWFPTDEDDWVILSDGVYGKVVQQTPERVVVLRLGGSRKIYEASSFIELAPENLSHGYRIEVTFGIDYRHQSASTTDVPAIFHEHLERRIHEKIGKENLTSLKVEFKSASASSLDYVLQADVTGEVASRHNVLTRLLQKAGVEVCNAQGWVIPFTQVTLHQA